MSPLLRVQIRTFPELQPILPQPVLARDALPDWLRTMPGRLRSEVLGGAEIRTAKHCPPLVDALGLGILFPLACDLAVADGELSWAWDPPRVAGGRPTRSPIGVHVPEQMAGAPFKTPPDQFVVKFTNFWTLRAPPGWSVLFTHPVNREELPFRTLTGLVDCDRFEHGFVHFPALWTNPDFTGVLPRGTPVAQAILLPRQALDLDIAGFDAAELAAQAALEDALTADPGLYRKRFRAARPRDGAPPEQPSRDRLPPEQP